MSDYDYQREIDAARLAADTEGPDERERRYGKGVPSEADLEQEDRVRGWGA